MIKLWQFFLCTFFLLCTLFRGVLGQWSWGVLYKLSSFARVDTSVRSIEATTTVSICETWSQLLNIVSSLECTNHRWKKTIICFRVSKNFDGHFIDKWHYIIWIEECLDQVVCSSQHLKGQVVYPGCRMYNSWLG